MDPDLKKALEALQAAVDAERKATTELETQLKAVGAEDVVTQGKVKAIEAAVSEIMDTIKALEKKAARPFAGIGHNSGDVAALPGYDEGYTKAFNGYLRSQKDTRTELGAALEAATKAATNEFLRLRAIAVGAGSTGGYAVPTEINQMIDKIVLEYSPFRQNCDVVQVGTTNWTTLVDLNGANAQWAAESGAITQSNTPTLASVAPTFGKLWAFPRVSEESLSDMFFNVEAWLASRVAEAFAAAESVAILTGDGTNKPTGILHTAPVATTDAAGRTFGTVQYVPTGTAATLGTIPGDPLIDLVYSLKTAYRTNAKFYMNRLTQAAYRKVKNTYGDYLWQPGMASGQPPTLMGYPIVESQDVADIAANAFPVLFGDMKAAYVIADRVGVQVLVDPYTVPGSVNFYTRKRMGGKLKKDEAIKALKCAAT